MVATLAGLGALLFGLALLLLPLLVTELSRPGDSAWGALVLVLALVLVTSAERLSGSPMLAVISGGLLVGRLTVEVGRGRWRQLTPEEKGRLGTRERWLSSLSQARIALAELLEPVGRQGAALLARWGQPGQPKASGKRWVRPEAAADVPSEAEASAAPPSAPPLECDAPLDSDAPQVMEVSDFDAIDALLQAAPDPVVTPGALSSGVDDNAPEPAAPEPAAASEEGQEGDARETEEGGAG